MTEEELAGLGLGASRRRRRRGLASLIYSSVPSKARVEQ